MAALEQLDLPWARRAFELCERHPEEASYVAGWLHDGGLERRSSAPGGWLLGECRSGELRGLVFISNLGILVPLSQSPACVDGITAIMRNNPGLVRVLIGERGKVRSIWSRLEALGFRERMARDQVLLSVSRSGFQPGESSCALELAGRAHADEIVEASAAMAREEARDDPQKRNPKLFRARIEERIGRQRDFVHRIDGSLVFKSNISALSPIGGQIEGVYTTPSFRRQGFGVGGTSWLTAWVLERAQRAVLLVNEDNHQAMRLYERLGFTPAHMSRTVFLAP